MKTKTMKILTVTITVLTVLMVVMSFSQVSFAAITTTPDQIDAAQPGNASDITGIAGKILGFLQVLAIALLVIMVAVLGIKYIAGSAEEKAEYKKTFVPLIVGAILVFAAVTIANFIFTAVS